MLNSEVESRFMLVDRNIFSSHHCEALKKPWQSIFDHAQFVESGLPRRLRLLAMTCGNIVSVISKSGLPRPKGLVMT